MDIGEKDRFVGPLRSAALVGAVGSLGLLLRSGRHTPRLLLALFVVWVISPFVAAVLSDVLAKRRRVLGGATLYCVTLVLTVGSLVIYGAVVCGLFRARPAAVFLLVPLGSWVVIGVGLVWGRLRG